MTGCFTLQICCTGKDHQTFILRIVKIWTGELQFCNFPLSLFCFTFFFCFKNVSPFHSVSLISITYRSLFLNVCPPICTIDTPPIPPSPICCWALKLLRKRSVNLPSKPQAEVLHSSLSTQRAVYLHPCTLLPWQPQPNTLACSTLFNFFLPFLISSLGSHAHSH